MTISDFHAAVGGTVAALGLGMTMVARSWTANPSRHRTLHKLPPENVLIGPASAYTAVDPDADTQAFGVVRIGIGWCDVCWETKAGVITRNGFRCDDFTQHPAGGAL